MAITEIVLEPYDIFSTPRHELSFENFVLRGYNPQDEENKPASINVRCVPIALVLAQESLLRSNERLKYASDVQRYSSMLGAYVFQNDPRIKEIEFVRKKVIDVSDNILDMNNLVTCNGFNYVSPCHTGWRKVRTVYWVQEMVMSSKHLINMSGCQLIVELVVLGLCRASIKNKALKNYLDEERKVFDSYIDRVLKICKAL